MAEKELKIRLTGETGDLTAKVALVKGHLQGAAGAGKNVLDSLYGIGQQAKEAEPSVHSFVGAFTAVAAVTVGLRALGDVVRSIGEHLQAGRDKANELAKEVIGARDALTALASVAGKPINNEFLIGDLKYQQKTGLKPEESRQFREEFLGAGVQNIGRNISETEAGQYQEKAAAYLATTGIEPGVMGRLAGSILGYSDFNKHGDKADRAALGQLAKAVKIAQRGKGRNPVLVRQMEMLAAQSLNEDEMMGTFQSMDEVATAVSIGAEAGDAMAGRMSRTAVESLRDFKGPAAPLLKEAGVDEKTPFFESLSRVAAVVKREGVDKGIKPEDYLKQFYHNKFPLRAVTTFINRGIFGGAMQDRLQFGAGIGAESAEKDIADYQQDPHGPGPQRVAEAKKRLAEFSKNMPLADLTPVRTEAEAELIDERKIDTDEFNAKAGVADKIDPARLLGFTAKQRDQEINSRMASILERRARAAGVEVGLSGNADTLRNVPSSDEYKERFGKAMGKIEEAGGNPIADSLPIQQRMADTLDRIDSKLDRPPLPDRPGGPLPTSAR